MLFNHSDSPIILIRGGGDLASGVALRLHRGGFQVVICELPAPLVVRRLVSFAQAVFEGRCRVEEVTGQLANSPAETRSILKNGNVAVLVDPSADIRYALPVFALVDARMLKMVTDTKIDEAPLVIGLGPGFTAERNCHAVVETNRGPYLGRVYWQGSAENDSGIPESVKGIDVDRVLRAPVDGILHAFAKIGDRLEPESLIAGVSGVDIRGRFRGVLRGLVYEGLTVKKGMKIGDLDPRCDARLCTLVSDKALAIGGGVLETILIKRNSKSRS